ncbi:hypothetical protein M9Y10_038271 [Tritrichomonas musculus]|uniref:Peptidase S54 rhomboid domain-containing protein n=1 Tax=Tritrichomonas musculus TaxID=1915356 RepID=A0ABR2K8Q1_9EUKA
MSTIIDWVAEKPVTFYFTVATFCISFFMLIVGMNPSYYFFIPSMFLAGQWWRVFTAPFVCPDGVSILISCLFLVYFGLDLEKKVNSGNYFKALIFGYGLIIISSIIISFIPGLPRSLYPIMVGPGSLIVFFLELLAQVSPNGGIKIIVEIPMTLIPIGSVLIFICLTSLGTTVSLGLLFGYLFPDMFPNIIKRIPNNAQNMEYKAAGYWVKKPSQNPRGKFSGKPHKLND